MVFPSSQGLICRDWKYIEYPAWQHAQLFDRTNDLDELDNLVDEGKYAGQEATMRKQLEVWHQRAR